MFHVASRSLSRTIAWLLGTVAAAAVASDVSAQAVPLTVESAVAIARTQSPQLGLASARRMLAEGRARADGALGNPLFEWRQENLRSDLQPDIFATVQLPVDITGKRLLLRKAIADGMERGKADSVAALRQLEFETVRTYWQASLAMALLDGAREDREARVRLAAFDSARFALGAVAEVVVVRTRLEASRARAAEVVAMQDAQQARAALARVMGVLLDSLPALATMPSLITLNGATDLTSIQSAVERALQLRPDVIAARHAVNEARKRASAERRGVVSDMQLVSGYKQTSGVHTGVVGVALPLPVLSRNEGAALRARGESLAAEAELRDMELSIRNEVVAATQAYAVARDAAANGVATLQIDADDIATIAEGAYREGAMSLMEVVEAQRTRAESRSNALRWITNVLMARTNVRMTTGESLTGNP
jgi:cobalt-zinc-cadmium efflux system outer membrane protein